MIHFFFVSTDSQRKKSLLRNESLRSLLSKHNYNTITNNYNSFETIFETFTEEKNFKCNQNECNFETNNNETLKSHQL